MASPQSHETNDHAAAADSACATVISVNRSAGGIPKKPIEFASVSKSGIIGDGHNHDKHNTPLQAISIIDSEDLDDLRDEGFDVFPGATGENVTMRGLDVDALAVGDVLRFSGGVVVELTKVRKPCYVLDAISEELKKAIVGRCGFYGRVVQHGSLRAGETVEVNRAGWHQDREHAAAHSHGDQAPCRSPHTAL